MGVTISFGVLGNVDVAAVEGGLLGCDFFVNLRDFRSEALVLGNSTAARFDDEAEEGPAADVVDVWVAFTFVRGVSEAPLMRRFFWGWMLFVLSDIDEDVNAEVDGEGGGSLGASWRLSIPNVRKKNEGKGYHVDLRTPFEVLLIP